MSPRFGIFALFVVLLSTQVSAAGVRVLDQLRVAPALALNDQAGRQHRLEDYRGRVVIVNFWASWCSPCIKEMPSLLATKRAFSENRLVVLAISLDDDWQAASSGLEDYASDFVGLLDVGGETLARWGGLGVPTAFVVDAEGNVRMKIVGGYDWEDPALNHRIEDLM